jgi:hypothetical protein
VAPSLVGIFISLLWAQLQPDNGPHKSSDLTLVRDNQLERPHRLNVPQTMRGVNGASNDVPFGTSMVVMFAVIPPGVPGKEICAEPDTAAAQVPTVLIASAALPLACITGKLVPH